MSLVEENDKLLYDSAVNSSRGNKFGNYEFQLC